MIFVDFNLNKMEPINKEKRKKAVIRASVLTAMPLIIIIFCMSTCGGILTKLEKVKTSDETQLNDSLKGYEQNENALRSLTILYKEVSSIKDTSKILTRSPIAISKMNKIGFGDFTLGDTIQEILVDNLKTKLSNLNNLSDYEVNRQALDSLINLYKSIIYIDSKDGYDVEKSDILGKIGMLEFVDFEEGDSVKALLIERITVKSNYLDEIARAEINKGLAKIEKGKKALIEERGTSDELNKITEFRKQLKVHLRIISKDVLERKGLPKKVKVKEEGKLYEQLQALMKICGNCQDEETALKQLFGQK